MSSRNLTARNGIIKKYKGQCPLCGMVDDDPTVHHILPLSLGGIDNESNMIVCCKMCHAKIHEGISIHKLSKRGMSMLNSYGGRPKRFEDSSLFEILDKYASGYISKEECCSLLNVDSLIQFSKQSWFQRWKRDRCIPNDIHFDHSETIRLRDHYYRHDLIIENGKYIGYAERRNIQ